MESGPSRVNAPLGDLRFQGSRGAFTASGKWQSRHQADKSRAEGAQHAKEEAGVEKGRTGSGAV